MQMDKLNDEERKLPRRVRRALQASRTTLIKKKTPFGRVKVIDFEVGDEAAETSMHNRTIYNHFTKGLVDRRTTDPLLWGLVA